MCHKPLPACAVSAAVQSFAPAEQVPALKRILQEEGSRGLWSGVRARVLFHMPAAAISWGVYESCKRMFSASAAAAANVAV